MLLPVLLLTLSAAPAPQRVPVLPLTAGDGVSASTAQSLTQALAAELRRRPGLEVLTASELSAVLGLARQRELLGCEAANCRAEVGGALEADLLVTGQLAKVGESWLMTVQLLEGLTARTLAQSMRRQKGGSVDGLLDVLPEMAQELFPQGGAVVIPARATAQQSGTTAPAAGSAGTAFSSGSAVLPLAKEQEVDVGKLVVATDGKGTFYAALPDASGPLFAGTKQGLFLQRVFGGSTDGQGGFDVSFWDPRANRASLALNGGKFTLSCGHKNSFELKPVPAKDARNLLKSAKLHDVRWQRRGHGLARDEEGVYYYVDRARTPEDTSDYRVWVGLRGRATGYPAELLASDAQGEVFSFGGSKLMLSERRGVAEVRTGGAVRALVYLDVSDHARFVYSDLGVYKGETLGTACDGRF